MTLQRREGGHGVCVARRSMGLLLDGGQARNLARQKTGTVATLASIPVHINSYNGLTTWNFQPLFAVSEKLQHWLSRSVSSTHSLPPPSTTHTLPPSQVNTEERQVERCRRLGRPTKARLACGSISSGLCRIKPSQEVVWHRQVLRVWLAKLV